MGILLGPAEDDSDAIHIVPHGAQAVRSGCDEFDNADDHASLRRRLSDVCVQTVDFVGHPSMYETEE